jgi:hypothetical protein
MAALRPRSLSCRLVVVSTLALALTGATAGTAAASRPQQSEYVVAEVPLVEGVLATGDFTQAEVLLCTNDDFTSCQNRTHASETLTFVPIDAGSAGTTVWADSSSANFDNFVAEITNGSLDQIEEMILEFPGGGGGGFGESEAAFFTGQTGPSGIDLSGYAIDAIGFRVDAVSFVAGTPELEGAFIFKGTIASSTSCMSGGWRSLHGPDSTAFANQGQCVQFVETGL